jgi:hypothetical protein
MPPRVCCAKTALQHSATTAEMANSRGIDEETIRMICLTLHSLEIEISPAISVGDIEKPRGK